MMTAAAAPPLSELDTTLLRPLARLFPTIRQAQTEIARLTASLSLPKGTIHVLSDVHGEDVKLRHVINNASGTLRPLVEKLFAERLSAERLQQFLTLLFYPHELLQRLEPTFTSEAERVAFARATLQRLFELVRTLARRSTLERALSVLAADFRELVLELLHQATTDWDGEYATTLIASLVRQDRVGDLIHSTVRVVRNLAIEELVLAGDFWDRGPRGDRVLEYLMRQPNVAIVWGNHDAAWLGAALGHEALLAHVLRISCRYCRLTQLEEGYGINLQPLEYLARTVYGDDPASCYLPKEAGLRQPLQLARMQKAAAILQFKLEGQLIARNPSWRLDHRRLLHRLDLAAGTVTIDGIPRRLRESRFPTLDPSRPYDLTAEEQACLDCIRESFCRSDKLAAQIRYLVGRGAMWLRRDNHLIFHGCLPVDEQGEFLPFEVDGRPRRGRELFDALEVCVLRALEERAPADLDLLWYLWCGPLSPLFGKDRIATFEIDLVEDPATHAETKNPYFQLLHEAWFCDKVLAEFGIDPQQGLIVNGHVPVKIEKGESPVKRSGKAITIDGAFSAAYGDHGYTLVLEPERTFLAKHHHFESVEAAVRDGVDIIPSVQVLRTWTPPRRVADTEQGAARRAEIGQLERLVAAYRSNRLRQT